MNGIANLIFRVSVCMFLFLTWFVAIKTVTSNQCSKQRQHNTDAPFQDKTFSSFKNARSNNVRPSRLSVTASYSHQPSRCQQKICHNLVLMIASPQTIKHDIKWCRKSYQPCISICDHFHCLDIFSELHYTRKIHRRVFRWS
jgi:hypothetical protein